MRKSIIIDGQTLEYELSYKKVKNLNLRINRKGEISVSAPMRFPLKRIESFLVSKSDFITSALERFKIHAQTCENKEMGEGSDLFVLGERFTIQTEPGKAREVIFSDGRRAIVRTPDGSAEAVRKAVIKLYDTICQTHIYPMCEHVYESFSDILPKMPEIKFRRAHGRWGSCYSKGNKIILNKFLAATPDECIEYVIYHEFVHFLQPNHSADFYRELQKHCPDHKLLKKRLEEYSGFLDTMRSR